MVVVGVIKQRGTLNIAINHSAGTVNGDLQLLACCNLSIRNRVNKGLSVQLTRIQGDRLRPVRLIRVGAIGRKGQTAEIIGKYIFTFLIDHHLLASMAEPGNRQLALTNIRIIAENISLGAGAFSQAT